MRALGPTLAFAFAASFTLVGCLEEPSFETAYLAETDLCAPEAAPEFAALVAECETRFLADGSCAGILSFRGSLDLVDGIASSRELDRTDFVVTDPGAGPTLVTATLAGRAPFFAFAFQLDDVGGLLSTGDTNRVVDLGRTSAGVMPNLTDDRLTFTLRLEDGAASKEKEFRTGNVTITRLTATELAGTLTATNFAEDSLTGCFHAFVTGTTSP